MKRSLIPLIFTVLIIAVMQYISENSFTATPVSVTTMKPAVKNIYDSINAKGKIREGLKKDLYSENYAKVIRVFAAVGESIKTGDVIMELEPLNIEDVPEFEPPEIDTDAVLSVFGEYGIDIELPASTPEDTEKQRVSKVEKQIKSPIDGTVTQLDVSEGDVITPINKLVSVSDFNNLYVSAMVPESYSSLLKEGQAVEISGEAFGARLYRGTVEKIFPVAKQVMSLSGSNTTYIETRVNIRSPDKFMRPGLNVNAKITANSVKDALTLPYECIIQDDTNREAVFIADNGAARLVYIITGYELDSEVEVKTGINKESNIIINPPEYLKNGDLISVSE